MMNHELIKANHEVPVSVNMEIQYFVKNEINYTSNMNILDFHCELNVVSSADMLRESEVKGMYLRL